MEAPGAEERFRRLIEIGRGVLAELDIEVVLQHVIEAARELTGARYAALGVLDEPKENLERFIHAGVDPETTRMIGELPRGRGVLGELIRNPEPLRLADVSAHARSYGFPAGHPAMRTFLGVPISIRGEAFGNLYITEKSGGREFTEEDEEAVVILADWAAIAIEHARLFTGLTARTADLQLALRQLETSVAITDAIGGETDLDRVLELIVKRARALVEAKALAVFLAEEEGDLVVASSTGEMGSELAGTRVARHGTHLGAVALSGEAMTIEGGASAVGDIRDEVGAERALLVPLIFHGRCLGVLAAFDPAFTGHEGEDLRLMRSFATSAATAVATAQSVEQGRLGERVEAAERERHHWAHELHDQALQQLGAIRLDLANSLRAGDEGGDALRAAARDAVDRLAGEIDALSRLINELRPVPLETLGLSRALQTLAGETAERAGLEMEVGIDLPERVSPEAERAVYRVMQESLNNVVKHAKAARVKLDAEQRNGEILLRVADDGAGFDVAVSPRGVGLSGMRERVRLLGGVLEIESRPGRGTEVTARIPVSP